jgi:hypothetical protein
MVSGPSPDAKEAVKLDLSQIRAVLWLNFRGPRQVSELPPDHDGNYEIFLFFILPNPKYKITKIPNHLILDKKVNEFVGLWQSGSQTKNVFF